MKKLLFFLLLIPQLAFAQYKASNGIVYNVGDTITIGKGTGFKGSFLNIRMNGASIITAESPDDLNMRSEYSGLKAIIKKIKVQKPGGLQEKTCFITWITPFNYIIYVESALESGELK